jgi:homoserine dehydrogenase
VADKPGAFGTIASILGKKNVSISAASQKTFTESSASVPVVVLTHKAQASDLEEAIAEIKSSGVVEGEPVALRVL